MIEVNLPDLPGIGIVPSQRRFYPKGSIAAHVVGYVGQPSDADFKETTTPLIVGTLVGKAGLERSEEHTSELQSLMRISYAVFCLKKNNRNIPNHIHLHTESSHTQHTHVPDSL